jgi:uncharacterized repeat protein (TIGR01451 family)
VGQTLQVTYQVVTKASASDPNKAAGDGDVINFVFPTGHNPNNPENPNNPNYPDKPDPKNPDKPWVPTCTAGDPLCTENPLIQLSKDVLNKAGQSIDGQKVNLGDTLYYVITIRNLAQISTRVDITDDLKGTRDNGSLVEGTLQGSTGLSVTLAGDGRSWRATGTIAAASSALVRYDIFVNNPSPRHDNDVLNFVFPTGDNPNNPQNPGEPNYPDNPPPGVPTNPGSPDNPNGPNTPWAPACQPGDSRCTINPIPPTYGIGDKIWNDTNRDGIQDTGEPGLGGVTVTITCTPSGGGTVIVRTTTTDQNGYYFFDQLPPGQCQVKVSPPSGYEFVPRGVGSNPRIDSNCDATGTTTTIDLLNDPNLVDAALAIPNGYPLPVLGTRADLTIDCGLVQSGPLLKIEKTADPPEGAAVSPNQVITYTIKGTNTSQQSISATITDFLTLVTPYATYVQGSLTSTIPTDNFSISGDRIVWQGVIGPGQTVTIKFQVRVKPDVREGTIIENMVVGEASVVPPGGGTSTKYPANCDASLSVLPAECGVKHPVTVPRLPLLPDTGSPISIVTAGLSVLILGSGGGLLALGIRKRNRDA